jgi:autotransporter-associated beta strand protein
MQLNWRGLTDRIADLAALGFQRRRDVRRPRRSRTLRLQTEALESRNMLAWHPLLFAPHRPHTAAPAVHLPAPAHTSSTSGSQASTSGGTLRLSGPRSGSGGATLAVGAVSIQGETTTNTGTLTLSAANTYTGSVLVQNGSLGTGTVNLQGGTLRFSNTVDLATIGAGVTVTVASGATLELAGNTSNLSDPTTASHRVHVVNNSTQTSGGTLLVSGTNQQVGAIDGTGTTVVNSGVGVSANLIVVGSLDLGGSTLTLSPFGNTVNLATTAGPGEAGWLHDTGGSTVVNPGADLTANHVVQNALVIGSTPFSAGIVTISASDASGNPLAGQLQLAPSLAPPADASTLAPPVTSASPPALPYYWNQPG